MSMLGSVQEGLAHTKVQKITILVDLLEFMAILYNTENLVAMSLQ